MIKTQIITFSLFLFAVLGGSAQSMPGSASQTVKEFSTTSAWKITSGVVINELMASNTMTVTDQDGEYEDWIELYNNSSTQVDLSGYFLSDKSDNLTKWEFPTGTRIDGHGYLIVWADENGSEEGLHANFKLAKDGEEVYLVNSQEEIEDHVSFGKQEPDMGYARIPNGTGNFVIKEATFGHNNEDSSSTQNTENKDYFVLVPNPAVNVVRILSGKSAGTPAKITIFDALGRVFFRENAQSEQILDVSEWHSGTYFVKKGMQVQILIIQ